jgi:hypothetical protein
LNRKELETDLERLTRFSRGRRGKFAKRCRQAELEQLICESLFEDRRIPGTMELAKRLKVTPRTIRTYLKERREMLNGPEMYWLHLYAENEPVGPPELLAIEECARRTGLSVRERLDCRQSRQANHPDEIVPAAVAKYQFLAKIRFLWAGLFAAFEASRTANASTG